MCIYILLYNITSYYQFVLLTVISCMRNKSEYLSIPGSSFPKVHLFDMAHGKQLRVFKVGQGSE